MLHILPLPRRTGTECGPPVVVPFTAVKEVGGVTPVPVGERERIQYQWVFK